MGVERDSAGVVAEFRVIANSTHCVRKCINNTAGNGVSSSEIQQTWRSITEKRSTGHISDIYTVTSAENAGRIFPSKLFLAFSHICHDPAVSVIWRDKTEMWIFLALSSHFQQHYGFWQQSVWGIFQPKAKWNLLFSIPVTSRDITASKLHLHLYNK